LWKIPLFDTAFDDREISAVEDVIRSGWLTTGEVTQSFERKFADFVGARYAIAVSSCTAALHLVNRALDIQPGDEVICPSLTFVAGASSIAHLGGVPVFADVEDASNLCISVSDIERKITPRTRAIQVMHYAGYPCQMSQICRVAKAHDLYVVEDCAHSPGATLDGQSCGTFGDAGCFSFYSNKNMTTGEGGMITTNSRELEKRLRLLRSHGMTKATLDRHRGHAFDYDVVELGFNYRIDEMRSAMGLVQLSKLPENNARRREIDKWYKERLLAVPEIDVPFVDTTGESAHHIFPVLLPDGTHRQAIMQAMRQHGIQTSVHYPPVHLLHVYRDHPAAGGAQVPVTESVRDRLVSLPLYPGMTQNDVQYVCDALTRSLC